MTIAELRNETTDRRLDPVAVFETWLSGFASAIDSRTVQDWFEPGGFWRDILSLTWSRETIEGSPRIAEILPQLAGMAGLRSLSRSPQRALPRLARRSGREVVEGWFDFETRYGRGTGYARLVPHENGKSPRAWLLLTTLQALHGFEDSTGERRPTGDEYSKLHSSENWAQQRARKRQFEDRDPQVLVIGAGQGGLMLAARLGQMSVDTLVVDLEARIGDNWRARYNNLTIHNEVIANHFPYARFPETWPTWLPKDMVANWLEAYAEFLELNIWTSTRVTAAVYDNAAGLWHVTLTCGDGSVRIMNVPHVVAAMGVSGGLAKKPALPGLDSFAGRVMHSGEFTSGQEFQGQRVLVVGTGNSGHDIAQDLYVSGAQSVAMLQRGATCVISLEPCARISYSIYSEGIDPDDADLMGAALPYPMVIESYKHITQRTNAIDRELLAGLQRAGFHTHTGPDQTGFQLLYLRGLGGYYIDVGCSQLIIDGKVPVIQADDTDRFEPSGLRMADGSLHAFDLVVLATGFESMQEGIRRIFGDPVADRIGPIWGFDEKYNMRNMWTRTAQPGFWIMGGAILEARFNSRFLAVQIKAALEGVLPPADELPLDQIALPKVLRP